METGVKISNAVTQGDSDVLKVRLNNAIASADATAADFTYHQLCYSKIVGNQSRKVDQDQEDCNNKYSIYKKSAEIDLLSIIDHKISKGEIMSIAVIEITFRNILKHDYGIVEETPCYYLRRYLKDMILDNNLTQSLPNKCQIMPHLIQSTSLHAEIHSKAIDHEEKSGESDMKYIFDHRLLNTRTGKVKSWENYWGPTFHFVINFD